MINTFKSLYTFIKTELKWCFYKLGQMGVSLPDKFQYQFLLSKVKEIPNNIKFYPTAVSFSGSKEVDLQESIDMIDTSSVTTMNGMFYGCISLQSLDISGWNTSKVTSMDGTFRGCKSFTSLYIDNWDVSNVTTLQSMFYNCSSLTSLDLNNWNTSKVQSINGTFRDMVNLKMLNISNWDTSSVTNISYMFCGARKLPKVDLSGWDASNVTNTTYMFYDTGFLYSIIGDKTLQDVENGTVALRGLKVDIDSQHSKLRFASILALANGLADLTGANAKKLAISSFIYKNMYNDDGTIPTADVIAERQARIAAICAAKNWNFAH